MKVKVEVGFIILVYSSSLSLHVIKFSPKSIPQTGIMNQFRIGKQLTLFIPYVPMKWPKSWFKYMLLKVKSGEYDAIRENPMLTINILIVLTLYHLKIPTSIKLNPANCRMSFAMMIIMNTPEVRLQYNLKENTLYLQSDPTSAA